MSCADQTLAELIRERIQVTGPISFADFMALALYHPAYGYYRRSIEQIGCQGDFYTNVSVGPLFGQLLAFQWATWLQARLDTSLSAPASSRADPAIGQPVQPFQIVEAGAHQGQLAADILDWFRQARPDWFEQLQYRIIEPFPELRRKQEHRLASFAPHVVWVNGWESVPLASVRGLILSNELLDALPLYRVGWNRRARSWFEWRVDWTSNRFGWSKAPELSGEARDELHHVLGGEISPDVLDHLPDDFTIDLCPAAGRWWSEAAARLLEGRVMTFDYGLETEEFFAPQRANGTVRAYRSHRLAPDPLADPGRQDLTAHINFSRLRCLGEEQGLRTDFLGNQASFLVGVAEAVFADPARFGSWGAKQNRQFQTLTHPDHLGRSFRGLVQSRAPARQGGD